MKSRKVNYDTSGPVDASTSTANVNIAVATDDQQRQNRSLRSHGLQCIDVREAPMAGPSEDRSPEAAAFAPTDIPAGGPTR